MNCLKNADFKDVPNFNMTIWVELVFQESNTFLQILLDPSEEHYMYKVLLLLTTPCVLV